MHHHEVSPLSERFEVIIIRDLRPVKKDPGIFLTGKEYYPIIAEKAY